MTEEFLFVGLPYLALVSLLVGTAVRFWLHRYSISSLSSQFLEDRWLGLGSVPWHIGILIVLLGHLVAFLAPSLWRSILSVPVVLLAVETLGLAAATACALGLTVLLVRRLLRGRLQKVTSVADYVVLLLLLSEVVLGILIAISHRWGALWSTGTAMPYVRSLFTLQPNVALLAELPPLVKTHVVVAFVIFAILPFTRLVHAFFVPLGYLFRRPQKVVWTSERRKESLEAEPGGDPDLARRNLLEGVVGAGAAAALLGVGVTDKLVKYFAQPSLTRDTKAALLTERHLRVVMTAEERALELERLSNDQILIGSFAELSEKRGKYFIDYDMRPALAFLGTDGVPIVLSAKCTHLGCTVGNEVDTEGRILCPCHVSYFDVKTGVPNQGAPAKAPLPRLSWAARNASGELIAEMGVDGRLKGKGNRESLANCNLYVVKTTRSEVI
jgi:nitrate reductase gamma subunit